MALTTIRKIDGFRLECTCCDWHCNVINQDPEFVASCHIGCSGTYTHVVSIIPAKFIQSEMSALEQAEARAGRDPVESVPEPRVHSEKVVED